MADNPSNLGERRYSREQGRDFDEQQQMRIQDLGAQLNALSQGLQMCASTLNILATQFKGTANQLENAIQQSQQWQRRDVA